MRKETKNKQKTEIPPFVDRADFEITEEAERLVMGLLEGKAVKRGQWADKYKKSAMHLLWRCYAEGVPPPHGLVILIGILFGDRYDWQDAKFYVARALAEEFDPPEDGQNLPRGAQALAAKTLEECGGLLKTQRPLDAAAGNVSRSYPKTAKALLDDPILITLWRYFRTPMKVHSPKAAIYAKENIKRIVEDIVSTGDQKKRKRG